MPIPQLRLDEAIDQVLDAMVARCKAQIGPGLLLEDVEDVNKGGRARRRPDPPYVWVTLAQAAQEDTDHALHEKWRMSAMLNAFVQSEQPEDGWVDAMLIASRARSACLAGRDLDLTFVTDVVSGTLEPIGQISTGRKFGAFARLDVTFTILET